MFATKNHVGIRLGKLVAVSKAAKGGVYKWECDCGGVRFLKKSKAARAKHCGCMTQINLSLACVTHGHAKGGKPTATLNIWRGMVARCSNPNLPCYHNYMGRGITVCQEWRDDFMSFLRDMGEKPEGMSLDRIDNNGNYCKENCRWATRKQQNTNRRNNVMVTIGGVTKNLWEWCAQSPIAKGTILSRRKAGWSDERAITTPARTQRINPIK